MEFYTLDVIHLKIFWNVLNQQQQMAHYIQKKNLPSVHRALFLFIINIIKKWLDTRLFWFVQNKHWRLRFFSFRTCSLWWQWGRQCDSWWAFIIDLIWSILIEDWFFSLCNRFFGCSLYAIFSLKMTTYITKKTSTILFTLTCVEPIYLMKYFVAKGHIHYTLQLFSHFPQFLCILPNDYVVFVLLFAILIKVSFHHTHYLSQ